MTRAVYASLGELSTLTHVCGYARLGRPIVRGVQRVASNAALAHGSWRSALHRLQESIAIHSSPAAVWQVLGDFGEVARWAPGISSSSSRHDGAAGVGASRWLRHVWGFSLEERITTWDSGRGYSFIVLNAPFPISSVRETWAIEASAGNATAITAVEYEMQLGALGRLIDLMLVRHLIRREMRRGLAGLKRYVETAAHQTAGAPDAEISRS